MERVIAKMLFDGLPNEQKNQLKLATYKLLELFESSLTELDKYEQAPMDLKELVRLLSFESARKHVRVSSEHFKSLNLTIEVVSYDMMECILSDMLDTYDWKITLIENYINKWQNL